MKHFVVEINYTVPLEIIESLTESHREYLQLGYKQGLLLVSGPKVPRTGGVVIAKAESLEIIEQFFSKDPYAVNNAAGYRFIEFHPKSRHEFLADWID